MAKKGKAKSNMTIDEKFSKALENALMDKDKKMYLEISKINKLERIKIIKYFEDLDKYEKEIGKSLINFTAEEYYKTYEKVNTERSVRITFSVVNGYIVYYCLKNDIDVKKVGINNISINDINKFKGNSKDKKYLTEEEYNTIIKDTMNSSLDPIYDSTLIKLSYRGLTIKRIINLKIGDIDITNNIILSDGCRIKVDDDIMESVIATYNIRYLHKQGNHEVELDDSDYIFKTNVDFKTEQAKIMSFNMRIRKKVSSYVAKDLNKTILTANLRYSGKFNYVNKRASDYGLNFIDDITSEEKIDEKKVNVYRKILREYDGSNIVSYNALYQLRLIYLKLATSMKNGIVY